MWFPFLTSRYSTSQKTKSKDKNKKLERRKGGGGRGGGSSSSGGGKSGTSSVGGVGGTTASGRGTSVSVGGGTTAKSSSAYGNGGGPISTIPSGGTFAGRQQGGGNRGQVVGTSYYGSGYPVAAGYPYTGRGVANRGFPFFFWPVAWGGAAGVGGAAYYHNHNYGDAKNDTRPGGPETTATFLSIKSNTTLRILADNSSTIDLIYYIRTNCSQHLDSKTSTTPSQFDDSGANNRSSSPRPEQAIQYYRASSVALTLDGYNNSATYGDGNGEQTPLPAWIDNTLLDCVNGTIVAAVPLIDNGAAAFVASGAASGSAVMMGLVVWVGLWMSQFVI